MTDASAYHEQTNHTPESIRRSTVTMDPANKPRTTKRYLETDRIELDRITPPWDPALSLVAERRADPLARTDQRVRTPIDLEVLATLCYEASGITNEVDVDGRTMRFRAASCTGKLYHVDCYVVCGDLADLDAGIYHFDPATFAFDVVRTGDFRGVLTAAAGAPSASAGDPSAASGDPSETAGQPVAENGPSATGIEAAPVTVVTTSTWWRNAWKYRDRTYRHAFWDAGTVLANLLATAHGLDLQAGVVAGFADDPVAKLLGVDPREEGPLALVPIGSGSPVPEPPTVEPIDHETAPLSPNPREYPLIYEAWNASTLPDGAAASEWRAAARSAIGAGTAAAGDGDSVPLDPVDHETASGRPLHPVVVRRGSNREFAEAGPSRRKVGTVLDRATRGLAGDWNGGVANGLEYLTAYVLATGVDGIPDGTYQYHPADGGRAAGDDDPTDVALERLGPVDRGTKAHLALDQQWAGDAHVNVYLTADVDAIVAALGNRGYRLVQLEAGLVLGRLYLATYAHRELGGTGLTFFDDLVADHLAPRADGQMPMTMFCFGRRAE